MVAQYAKKDTAQRERKLVQNSMSELFGAEAEHMTRRFGRFVVQVTRSGVDPAVPGGVVALVRGDLGDGEAVPCRIASACVMSTALDSADCDCREQLDAAMGHIARTDRGVVIYLTHQEGRGHGLEVKIRALEWKNRGHDTFDAVRRLGLDPDVRNYDAIPPILEALGVRSAVLLTNNPDKIDALIDEGVKVTDIEHLSVEPSRRCQQSMRAKQDNGHAVIGRYTDAPSLPYP